MIHPNSHRHDKPAVFFPVLTPVDDWGEKQITIGQFDIQ